MTCEASRQDPSFPTAERCFLLRQPGIGASVVQRLEQTGIASLAQLERTGVDVAVMQVCAMTGGPAWSNRLRSLQRALALYTRV